MVNYQHYFDSLLENYDYQMKFGYIEDIIEVFLIFYY